MNLEALEEAFATNFSERGEVGASVAIYDRDGEVVSIHRGIADREGEKEWTSESIVPVWSATKGVASAVVLKLLAEADFDLDTPVSEIWPELTAQMNVGQLMSHQGGLAALDQRVSVTQHDEVIQALEEQEPNWPLGEGHGYHPRTFGFLLEALATRLDGGGRKLAEIWREEIAEPMALDFWIGLPEEEFSRVAELRTARVGKSAPKTMPPEPDQSKFLRAFGDPDSLTRAAFVSPVGYHAVADLNKPDAWKAGWASMGGIGSAAALAKFYAMLANRGAWAGDQIIPEIVCDWAETTLVSGEDKILLVPTAFSAGLMRFQYPKVSRAYGHAGAGGSHAFADPERGIGFAYVMNQMEQSVLPSLKSLSLIESL